MGALDLIRNAFQSPATRRIRAAEEAAELWASAPKPSKLHAAEAAGIAVAVAAQSPAFARRQSPDIRVGPDGFGPPQGPPRTPPIAWGQDQPPPPPTRFAFAPGYSDHTYQQFSAPLAFDGFGLDRIRAAITAHRLGIFWESSALMVAVLGFAPVLAALRQAVAPIIAIARHVHGGDRGLAKLVAAEIEDMLIPRVGLLPSPYFPPQLWGTTAIYLRMMGFGVWQHVDGDPDYYTGIRPRYTRIWEPWSTQMYRSPRKVLAITTEGNVEIKNDGKFTLIANENEPHLTAAINALPEEVLGGKLTQEARVSFFDFFGKPKIYATMPEKVATSDAAGDDFVAAVETIYSPDGRGVLPYGAKLDAVAIPGEGSGAFKDAMLDYVVHVFMVLTGSAGTIGNGMNTGAGPGYQPAKGGAWGVLHHLIAEPAIAMVRGTNQGVIAPYCDENYGEDIEGAKRAGAWKYPVMEVPLPAPDRDERIESLITREKARTDIIAARRANGIQVTQDDADHVADELEVRRVSLSDTKGAITKDDMQQKLFGVDEYRAAKGYDPLPDGAGTLGRLAEERLAGGDQVGALAKVDAAEAKDTGEAAQHPQQDATKGASAAPAEAKQEAATSPEAPEDGDGPTTKRSAGSRA